MITNIKIVRTKIEDGESKILIFYVGSSLNRGVSRLWAQGAYAPNKTNQGWAYAFNYLCPDEIQNCIFLPLMKKALMLRA